MKKWIIWLCAAAFLLCGCGPKEDDTQVAGIRQQILALPTVEEFVQLPPEGQQETYEKTQQTYEAYMALTEDQRRQITEAEDIFGALFSHFNAQVQPIVETAPETTAPELPPVVLQLSEEDKTLLLKIGMAERGSEECVTCIALVMRTVLNRVESDRFADTIHGVLYTPDQFTPVMDGSFAKAEPNALCEEALDMVIRGWDESQGAYFYEWCQGESWHSKNLQLLFQHCDIRFYQ